MKVFLDRKIALGMTFTVAMLAGCDNTATEVNEDDGVGMLTVESEADLGDCNESKQGAKVFVEETSAVYQCQESGWVNISSSTVVDTVTFRDTVSICNELGYRQDENVCLDLGLLSICGESNDGELEKNSNGMFYVCRNGSWQKARDVDMNIDKVCSHDNDGESVKWLYSNWVCRPDSIGWAYDFENIAFDSLEYGAQVYRTVGVGSQLWMAENLNYSDTEKFPDLKDGSKCLGNNGDNCEIYGRLYNWAAMMNLPQTYNDEIAADLIQDKHQGICPDGWHIPSVDDWELLKGFVKEHNGNEGVGVSLKSKERWQQSSTPGSDRFGFGILPAGAMSADGKVENQGIFAVMQSSAEESCSTSRSDTSPCSGDVTPVRADVRYDESEMRYLQSNRYSRHHYMSVRCLKD